MRYILQYNPYIPQVRLESHHLTVHLVSVCCLLGRNGCVPSGQCDMNVCILHRVCVTLQ